MFSNKHTWINLSTRGSFPARPRCHDPKEVSQSNWSELLSRSHISPQSDRYPFADANKWRPSSTRQRNPQIAVTYQWSWHLYQQSWRPAPLRYSNPSAQWRCFQKRKNKVQSHIPPNGARSVHNRSRSCRELFFNFFPHISLQINTLNIQKLF